MNTITLRPNVYYVEGPDIIAMEHADENGALASGFHTHLPNGVLFHKRNGDPVAAAIEEKGHGPAFWVSASRVPDTQQVWFQFALDDLDARKLGINHLTDREQCNLARRIIDQLKQTTA